jgi:hypothetical protein
MKDSAIPLYGWLPHEYMPNALFANADMYGSLFFFLRNLFTDFCKRVQNMDIEFQLYSMDARELPQYLLKDGRAFDRIEVCYTPAY